ncbi:sialin-like isoform X2 [Diadema antillarum]|uniref:sialin-like isoform X2 n=1 Tax=Diadema antillarum TaxID=105358 RepID=UPI003A84CDAE
MATYQDSLEGFTFDTEARSNDETLPLLSRGKYNKGSLSVLCSARYSVCYVVFLGFVVSFMGRVNMSVAITAMVNSSYSSSYDAMNTSAEICPLPPDEINQTNVENNQGEFPWDAHTQELVLSAFFYGVPILMIPLGILCDRYSRASPWVYGLGILLSSICTLFTPLAAYSGVGTLFVVRFLGGLAESGTYPAIFSLMSRWSPVDDRSRLMAISFSGISVGQVLGPPISGIISSSTFLGGWPASFYLCGICGVLWFILWSVTVYDSPMSHPRISQQEREYILAKLHLPNKKRSLEQYPWKSILTSVPLLAATVGDFSLIWTLYLTTTNLPIFLTEALRFNVSKAGILSSLPYLILALCIIIGGVLADAILASDRVSLTTTRKIMSTLGYVGCNATLAITFLSLGVGFTGLSYSGVSLTPMEFAPPYSGLTSAVVNTVAAASGFIVPLVIGVYTRNQASKIYKLLFPHFSEQRSV